MQFLLRSCKKGSCKIHLISKKGGVCVCICTRMFQQEKFNITKRINLRWCATSARIQRSFSLFSQNFRSFQSREFLRKCRQYKPLTLKNQFTKGDAGTNPKLIWKLKRIWLWWQWCPTELKCLRKNSISALIVWPVLKKKHESQSSARY